MGAKHDGVAGASARAEYERLRDTRLGIHRRRFGPLAWLTARIDGESDSERAWRRGAEGEERVGRRLEELLRDRGVAVLNDLRVPGTRANIDHLCVGPGGVTVVDTKRYRGKARVDRGRLWVGGRNRTRLVEGVAKQVAVVRTALAAEGLDAIDTVGAICWSEANGLPLLRNLRLDGVRIAGPQAVAKLARRPAGGGPVDVERVVDALSRRIGRTARQPRPSGPERRRTAGQPDTPSLG